MSNPTSKIILILSIILSIIFVFLAPNRIYADTVISQVEGTINDEQTWSLVNSPYIVNSNIVINQNSVLNIEAGTVIKMQSSSRFDVYGTLNILGNLNNNVSITTQGDDGSENQFPTQAGRWSGFVFYPNSKGNLNYLKSKYAGFSPFPPPGGPAILNQGGDIAINNSEFSKNFVTFYLKSGTTTITHSTLDKNTDGISFENGFLDLTDSTISNSTGQAFSAYNQGKIFLRNNTFLNNRYNAFFDLSINFDIASTSFIGGDVSAWRIGGTVRTIKTLPADLYVLNSLFVEEGGEFTINPGTVLKTVQSGGVYARGGIINFEGTEDYPIIFTSIADDSVGGDTNNDGNLTIGESFKTAGVVAEIGGTANISNTVLNYASGNQFIGPYNPAVGSLVNMGGVFNINNLDLENGNYTAIHHYQGTTTIQNLSIKSGFYNNGIVYDYGDLNVHNSSITGNISFYALWNRTNAGTPDVRNNWWGSPTGPYHSTQNPTSTSTGIVGNALFIPFLTSPPTTTTPQTIDPVIIIPGIMGSAYKNGTLVIDPILHTYDDLLATLKANGYTEGVDLFTFPYEWRDSNVLNSAFLRNKINEIQTICSCQKVDLVAHSMGGLIARQYIQSTHYGDDVDQLIFLGTPHKGSQQSYLRWEAGEFESGTLNFLTKYFFTEEAEVKGFQNIFDYIHNRPITSVQELLPTFDYLKDKDTGIMRTYPNNYPTNSFLENLNNNISVLLNSGVEITNIVGNAGNNTIDKIRVIPSTKTGLWEHGEPDGFYEDAGDNGLENGVGDTTVTIFGATLDNSIINKESQSTHIRIPTVEENEVFKILTGKTATTNIDSGFNISPIVLILQLQSPIDFVITAPDGKKIGKNFSNNTEYNEISNAFYSGFETDEEYITILNPLNGEYKVETQGTGNGGSYGILTSYITDTKTDTIEVTGTTLLNEITKFKVIVIDGNTNPIDIDLDAPNTSTIAISSPESKDYLRSEKINISASTKTGILSLSLLGNPITSGTLFDPFYAKLGTTTLFATSSIGTKPVATSSVTFRIVATYESTISDIERAFNLGWIYSLDTKNQLISRLNKAVIGEEKIDSLETQKSGAKKITKIIEKLTKKIDKELLKALKIDLEAFRKDRLNEQAYNIIKEDLNWLILNN